MTQKRALEILKLGAHFVDYSKHMTDDEIRFVNDGWDRMPGSTCFYDAIVRIAKQRWPFEPAGQESGLERQP
jgi:hypothetical protein